MGSLGSKPEEADKMSFQPSPTEPSSNLPVVTSTSDVQTESSSSDSVVTPPTATPPSFLASSPSSPVVNACTSAATKPPVTPTATTTSSTAVICPSPSTSTATGIGSNDINVLKFFMAVRKNCPVAKVFAAVFEKLANYGTTPILEHCLAFMGKNTFDRQFNKREKDKLSSNSLQDLDVTMLFKLLQHCCGLREDFAFWVQSVDSIEYKLYRLKEQRNFFAHDAVQLSAPELDSRLKLIKQLTIELCDRTGIDPTFKQEFLTQLDCIKVSSSLQAEYVNRQSELKAIKEDIQDDLFEQISQELRDRYNTMRVISPITWFVNDKLLNITVDKVFTKLTLNEVPQSDIPIEKILVAENIAGMANSTVVVSGIAGSGKTSLCRYLIYSWMKQTGEVESLENYRLLIFIQCRYVRSNSLDAFLKQDLLKDSLYLIPETEVFEMLHRFQPLFVVDGYDEADPRVQNLIMEVYCKFPSNKIIITSRPHVCPGLTAKLMFNHTSSQPLSLKIEGFNDDCILEYTKKLFSVLNHTRDCDAFIQYISEKKKLKHVIELPLTLSLLILLWIDDRSNINEISTEGQIHFKIIEMMKQRLTRRLLENCTTKDKPIELKKIVETWLHILGEIALERIANENLYLNENNMLYLKEKLVNIVPEFDLEDAMSSIFQCETSISLSSCEKIWSFIHTTQQEMMAALYVVKEVEESRRGFGECFPSTNFQENEQMVNTVLFALELISPSNLTEECGKFIAKSFPLHSSQNIMTIGSVLSLVDNEEIMVNAFHKYLETNSLPCVMYDECIGIITNLMEQKIVNPHTEVTFHAPCGNFEDALRDLNNVGCVPSLILDLNHYDTFQSFIEYLKAGRKELQSQFILSFWPSFDHLKLETVIASWDWSQPLKITTLVRLFAFKAFSMIEYCFRPPHTIKKIILENVVIGDPIYGPMYDTKLLELYCERKGIELEIVDVGFDRDLDCSSHIIFSIYKK